MNNLRIAAKLLRISDLTLFRSQYTKLQSVTKQKAINLNRDIFIGRFYPALAHLRRVNLSLEVRGPGAKQPLHGTATALLSKKNWRLDGRLIEDPPDEPGRFGSLAEGDIAVLAFEGNEKPESVTVLLVSATQDEKLHALLKQHCRFSSARDWLSTRDSMRVLEHADVQRLAANSDGAALLPFVAPDSIEDALYGPMTGPAIPGNGRGGVISPDQVRSQAASATELGQLGEDAFEVWLSDTGHDEGDFEWVSKVHARAAFDFEVTRPRWKGAGQHARVDVKSTRGEHGAVLHMSFAEIRWAASDPTYRLARISALSDTSAHVAILSGVHEFCKDIEARITKVLVPGVSVDSVTIDPRLLVVEFESDVKW